MSAAKKSGEHAAVKAYRKKLDSMGEETMARVRAMGIRIARAHDQVVPDDLEGPPAESASEKA